jgi:hypothetical protein
MRCLRAAQALGADRGNAEDHEQSEGRQRHRREWRRKQSKVEGKNGDGFIHDIRTPASSLKQCSKQRQRYGGHSKLHE